MFQGDSAVICAGKFPLLSMGGQAQDLACADTGTRTPIGASGNFKVFVGKVREYEWEQGLALALATMCSCFISVMKHICVKILSTHIYNFLYHRWLSQMQTIKWVYFHIYISILLHFPFLSLTLQKFFVTNFNWYGFFLSLFPLEYADQWKASWIDIHSYRWLSWPLLELSLAKLSPCYC